MDKNDAPASNSYLIVIYLTNWLACFSIGFSLIGYNTPGMVIEKQTGWSNNVTTYITTSCTIGLMCGSFACKFFLPYGRIRTIYFAQFLIMMSVVPQMWLTGVSLAIGRFLLGFAGGLSNIACPIFISETVPPGMMSLIGTATQAGSVSAMLLQQIVANVALDIGEIDFSNDIIPATENWRICFIVPGVCAFLNVFMWFLLIRQDSLYFLVDNDREEEARAQFRKVYFQHQRPGDDLALEWHIMKQDRLAFLRTCTQEPSLQTILLEKQYLAGTVFVIMAGMINQSCGINSLNQYSTFILAQIPGLSMVAGTYLIALANFIGVGIGLFLVRFFSLRTIFILQQFLKTGFLVGIVGFQLQQMQVLTLVSMIGMIFNQQILQSCFFGYISQVSTSAQNSLSLSVLYFTIILQSLLTQSMISGMGVAGTFGIYATLTILGGLYLWLYMKNTSGLTLNECKQAYLPEKHHHKSSSGNTELQISVTKAGETQETNQTVTQTESNEVEEDEDDCDEESRLKS